jgi:Methyltransferase domain
MLRKRVRRLSETIRADAAPPPWLLQSLVTCWANPWSVDSLFLSSMLRWLGETSGPIVECGSGLTTVVLVTAASATGRHAVSLEQEARFEARLAPALPRQIRPWLDCRVVPLVSYGEFDWYDVETVQLPKAIGLVVCDGPPGTTRGGRYGLAPILKDRLAPGCIVLVDDTDRAAERDIVDRWCAELPARIIERSERHSAILKTG